MNKFLFPIFLLLLVGCKTNTDQKVSTENYSTENRAKGIRLKLLNRDTTSVIVVAHRGDWRNFPENSIAAIDNAIKLGVDMVELDVQRTKDSVLILMHDANLDRTTTGKGKISETTLKTIKTLKLKNGVAIKTIHSVPTLEEALLFSKGRIMINLDKADRYFDEVFDLLEETGTTEQIVMKGNKSLEEVRELFGDYLEDVIYMPIVNLDKPDSKNQIELFLEKLKPVAFELLYKEDSNPLPVEIIDVIGNNSLIWYNTLWDTMAGGHDDDMSLKDPDLGYGYLIDTLGARIIQTDRPEYLLNYLRSRKLHN